MSTTNKEFNARNGALIGTSNANYLQLLGNTSGNAVQLNALGSDANISITLNPKGTGTVNIPSGTLTVVSGTANGILYLNGSGIVTSSANLTYNGTNVVTTGSITATAFIPSSGTVPTNGLYLPTTNTLGFSTNTNNVMSLDASGILNIKPSGNGAMQDYIRIAGSSSNSTDYHAIGNYATNELFIQANTYTHILRGYAYTSGNRKQTAADTVILIDNNNMFLAYDKGNVNIGYTADKGYKLAVNGNSYINGNLTVTTDVAISGNLTVNGTTTTINSNTVTVDDKNLELGSVISGTISTTGTVGTITGTGPWTATITGMSSTTGLIVGSTIAATAGTGTLYGGTPTSCVVASIVSATSITYTVTGGTIPTAGTVTTITTTGNNDTTAAGGGITLKGSTDKSIIWDATNGWVSSEILTVGDGKQFKVVGAGTLGSTQAVSFSGSAPVNSLTLDASGNLGVGISPVTSYKVAINGDYWQGNGSGLVIGTLINNAGWYELAGSSNVNGLQFGHAVTQRWMINSSEQMRLTTTGLGIGTSSPTVKLDVNGTIRNAAGIKTYSVTTVSQGNVNSTYEIMRISRDSANWSVQIGYEITVYNRYYRGGVTKWYITYNQVDPGTVVCTDSSGTTLHKVYLGTEVLVSGTINYIPVLVDIPNYQQVSIEVKYTNSDVTTINAAAQVQFTGTMSTGTGTNYSGDIHLVPNGGNVGVGTRNPTAKLEVVGSSSTTLVKNTTTTGPNGFNASSTGGNFYFGIDSSTNNFYNTGTPYGRAIYSDGAYPIAFFTNSTERMRLDSSGNVGIGTSSPAYKLDVVGTGTFSSTLRTGTASGSKVIQLGADTPTSNDGGAIRFNTSTTSTNWQISSNFVVTPSSLEFTPSTTAGGSSWTTPAMTLTSAGNLGLGVAPSASTLPGLQFGVNAIISGSGNSYISNNAVYNSGWKYVVSSNAPMQYQMSNSGHAWFTAPSGTAGAAISFTQAMTLDASGNLGLGSTSPLSSVGRVFQILNSGSTATLQLQDSTTGSTAADGLQIQTSGGLGYFWNYENAALVFGTNNTERARIDSSGNLGIGTSSPAFKLDVNGNISLSNSGLQKLYWNANGAYLNWIECGGIAGANWMRFATGNAEAMRLDSSGNLCIGTTSLNAKLTVGGLGYTASQQNVFASQQSTDLGIIAVNGIYTSGNAGYPATTFWARNGLTLATTAAYPIYFATNNTTQMTLDSSGNLGLGVTPSAWESTTKTFQFGSIGYVGRGNSGQTLLGYNNYINSSGQYIYLANTQASRYEQVGGEHRFYTAPSGTAGSAISFTQAMTLDASGNLGIGTSSPVSGYRATIDGGTNTGHLQLGTLRQLQFTSASDGTYDNAIWRINAPSSVGQIRFQTNSTDRVTIDSSGNLLVGTTSAGYSSAGRGLIEVNGSASSLYAFRVGSSNKGYLLHEGTNLYISNDVSGALILNTNGSEKMRLDSSGNLGLGVTPSGSSIPTFQSSVAVLVGNSETDITSNAYYNSGWKYVSTGLATQYQTNGGLHKWYTAPSGTAGTAVSFTQAMTLDASGALLVGATSNTSRGGSNTNALFYRASGTRYIDIQTSATDTGGLLFSDGSSGAYGSVQYDHASDSMALYTGGSERARIDSSGNFGIGTSSPGAKLQVQGAGGTSSAVKDTTATGSSSYANFRLDAGSAYANILLGNGSLGVYGGANSLNLVASDGPICFFPNNVGSSGTERMRLDSSGNLSLGVTPSGWNFGGNIILPSSNNFAWNGPNGNIVSNGYYAGGWKYQTTAAASRYSQDVGVHSWHTAPSGTAGNAISFTQAMTLDASGNLGIGVSSLTYKLQVGSSASIGYYSDSSHFASYQPYNSSTGASYFNNTNQSGVANFIWQGGGSERMRLDTSGNLGIGTSSPTRKLEINATTTGPALRLINTNSNSGIELLTASTKYSWLLGAQYNVDGAFEITPSTVVNGTTFSTPVAVFLQSGNVGIGTTTPSYKLHVVGSFAATTKSFVIDHPTKEGMKLRYGSLESPYHGIRLTGEATIKENSVVVNLPEYIHALVKQEGSQVQITNIKHGKVLWVDEIDIENNCFTIAFDRDVNDNKEYSFYWSFTAIRKDVEDMIVEF